MQVLGHDPETGDGIEEVEVLRTLEEVGPLPLLQVVNVVVSSIERVPVAEASSVSSYFRIPGNPDGSSQQAGDTEAKDFVVVVSEIAAYPGVPSWLVWSARVASSSTDAAESYVAVSGAFAAAVLLCR